MIKFHRAEKQVSGFTLVELMIAGSLGTVLSLVLFEMLLQAQHMADAMIMQSTLNGQAREVFDLLMDGGVEPSTTNRIPGFHGRAALPTNLKTTTSFRLQLWNTGETIALRTRETLPQFSITCSAQYTPVKTCGSNGATHTIDGFINEFTSTSLLSKTYDIKFSLIDPQMVPRAETDQRFTQSEYSSSFWTVFALNVD
ncbi:MAG: hypothetical protein HW380_332 [Magnetococcales bacterium]|nr:hypothetical protein [Magnetococcales bacterium]